jgi:hypothetical protein
MLTPIKASYNVSEKSSLKIEPCQSCIIIRLNKPFLLFSTLHKITLTKPRLSCEQYQSNPIVEINLLHSENFEQYLQAAASCANVLDDQFQISCSIERLLYKLKKVSIEGC